MNTKFCYVHKSYHKNFREGKNIHQFFLTEHIHFFFENFYGNEHFCKCNPQFCFNWTFSFFYAKISREMEIFAKMSGFEKTFGKYFWFHEIFHENFFFAKTKLREISQKFGRFSHFRGNPPGGEWWYIIYITTYLRTTFGKIATMLQ